MRGDMTVRITMERISDSEVRITLTADIRVNGNLGPLPGAPAQEAGSSQEGASLQEFLTVDQAAEVLHVSRDNVYDLIRTGQLRSIKIGRSRRISRQWITQFAERPEHDKRSSP
jgi:excisionase family DNA binding protein